MLLMITILLVIFSFCFYKCIKDQEKMLEHQFTYSLLQVMEQGDINTINNFLQAIEKSGCSIEEYVSNLSLSYDAQVRMRNLLRSALDEKAESSKQKEVLEKPNRIVPFD